MLKWVFERITGHADGIDKLIGLVPAPNGLDITGLKVSSDELDELFDVNNQEWLKETEEMEHYLSMFGDRLPKPFVEELTKRKNALMAKIVYD